MDAFRMPKSNDEEIELRRAAIHSGTLEAANVPLQTAKLALDLLASLPALAQTGNSNAVTDVGVAGLLASAACKGALFNVEINLNSIPTDMGIEQREEMDEIREMCQKLSRSVMQTVNEKMRS
jgi:glutamate formiminotransferase/formiminotetrahydrofolate cyclodeaminase